MLPTPTLEELAQRLEALEKMLPSKSNVTVSLELDTLYSNSKCMDCGLMGLEANRLSVQPGGYTCVCGARTIFTQKG